MQHRSIPENPRIQQVFIPTSGCLERDVENEIDEVQQLHLPAKCWECKTTEESSCHHAQGACKPPTDSADRPDANGTNAFADRAENDEPHGRLYLTAAAFPTRDRPRPRPTVVWKFGRRQASSGYGTAIYRRSQRQSAGRRTRQCRGSSSTASHWHWPWSSLGSSFPTA